MFVRAEWQWGFLTLLWYDNGLYVTNNDQNWFKEQQQQHGSHPNTTSSAPYFPFSNATIAVPRLFIVFVPLACSRTIHVPYLKSNHPTHPGLVSKDCLKIRQIFQFNRHRPFTDRRRVTKCSLIHQIRLFDMVLVKKCFRLIRDGGLRSFCRCWQI